MAYTFKQCKLNVLHLANPELRTVFAKGQAMFYLQNLAAPAVGVLAAKAASSAASPWTTGITQPEHPRSLQVVFGGAYDGGDITITGYDQFGRAQTEIIADNAGNTVQGTKVWWIISSIAKQTVGASANTFEVQTGEDHVGLPVPLLGAWGLVAADGVAELATYSASVHSFKPATTPDGSVDFTVLVSVDWAMYYKMVRTEMDNISPSPSVSPSISPSISPSLSPSISPSVSPSISPSLSPSLSPSISPSLSPSVSPSLSPSISQSLSPSISPSISPSLSPSISPSLSPSVSPSS